MASQSLSTESQTAAEPPHKSMKSHSAMNQAIARLLSDDQLEKKRILSQVSDKDRAQEQSGRKRSRQRKLSSGSSGGEEEMRKKRSKTTKDKPTASRVGGAHEEGCVSVSGEKRDVVKACHVLPSSSSSLEKERAMQRVATRAVVQLFNAVRKHQKEVESKLKDAGKSERKKTKILSSVDKKDFLSHLKTCGDSGASKTDSKEQPMWSVLRDDFTKGSKLKDWDQQDQQQDQASPVSSDSDSEFT